MPSPPCARGSGSRCAARSRTSRSPRRDAIRHWADGIGDRNPFWLRHGIAPPTILFAMDRVVSGLCRRPAGHPCHVRGNGFSLAAADPRGRSHHRRQHPARPGREAVDLRPARHPADVPHHVPESGRSRRLRGGFVVLQDRARHGARTGKVQGHGRARGTRRRRSSAIRRSYGRSRSGAPRPDAGKT